MMNTLFLALCRDVIVKEKGRGSSRVVLCWVQEVGIRGMWADGEHGYRNGYQIQMGKFYFVLQGHISNRMHRSSVLFYRV